MKPDPTIDFAAPAYYGSHRYYLEIPPNSNGRVNLWEDVGFAGDAPDRESVILRATLMRKAWNGVRDTVQGDFNERIKVRKHSAGKWHTGKVFMDRMLGRELCVLLWALEKAKNDQWDTIVSCWRAMLPEERWWLFNRASAASPTATSPRVGWRLALRTAFSGCGESSAESDELPSSAGEEVPIQLILNL